jgi:hypothetical protein
MIKETWLENTYPQSLLNIFINGCAVYGMGIS